MMPGDQKKNIFTSRQGSLHLPRVHQQKKNQKEKNFHKPTFFNFAHFARARGALFLLILYYILYTIHYTLYTIHYILYTIYYILSPLL